MKSYPGKELKALEAMLNSSSPIQKQGLEEELLQEKFDSIQKQEIEEEELVQGKFETAQKMSLEEEEPIQGKFETIQKQENNTGLPDKLKSGIENLSAFSMDDVKVHYNSSKPATLQAHAYAQGTEIHLASGQEKHLPHEAWHVVQQKQGRVKPTLQMKGGVNVNDDAGLEKEADVMGGKAIQIAPSTGDNTVQRNVATLGNFTFVPIDFHVTDLGDDGIQEIAKKFSEKYEKKEEDVKSEFTSMDNQWIGGGNCDKIFGVYKGSGTKFNYRHRKTGNTWNHVAGFNESDGVIYDASWKQFFSQSLEITSAYPPIFNGTADELRNFGLPTEDVESYLDMFGIGDNSKPDS